jgi:Myb-like DNA-binding domain
MKDPFYFLLFRPWLARVMGRVDIGVMGRVIGFGLGIGYRRTGIRWTMDCSAMEAALAANLKLQDTLRLEMARIAAAKASNRAQVAALTRQWFSLHSWPIQKSPPPLSADLKRKWNRRFFYDSKSRIREPSSNPDTVQRRAIESRYFWHHLQPPWSKKENEALLAAVAECCGSKDSTSTDSTMPDDHVESASIDIDFTRVAQTLSGPRKKKDQTKARTKQECQIQCELLQKKKSPFTKSELKIISQRVSSVNECLTPMLWEEIATELSTHSQTRTAHDCLVAYHAIVKSPSTTSVLSTVPSSAWTVLEDELLLKFLAAAGPQMVVDSRNALLQGTLLQQLLPNKSKKQLFTRIQQSLLNPNLHRREWSPTEERRLAILMKLYHINTDRTMSSESASVWRSDLFLASTHCHGRTIKSVADKWQRSINPDYSSRPFTTAEDQRLLAVLRSQPAMGWSELSSLHFKDRHPNRLLSRWSELATDQDIVNREQALQAGVGSVGLRRRQLGAVDDGHDAPQHGGLAL